MGSVEVMVVGMVVALVVHEAAAGVAMAVVVDLWVLLRRLETGDVVSDLMHTVEAEAVVVVVSGVEETATSGLSLSLCQFERGLTSKRQLLGSHAKNASLPKAHLARTRDSNRCSNQHINHFAHQRLDASRSTKIRPKQCQPLGHNSTGWQFTR
jgi:hypothetical protein